MKDNYGYICDIHYSLLKDEHEEFSTPILGEEKCDFCDNSATHWLPRKLISAVHFKGDGNLTVIELIDLLKKRNPSDIVLVNISDYYYTISRTLWYSEQKEKGAIINTATILDAVI